MSVLNNGRAQAGFARLFASRGRITEARLRSATSAAWPWVFAPLPDFGMHPGLRESELARSRFGFTAAVRLGRDAGRGG
jgi:hypothetical protein